MPYILAEIPDPAGGKELIAAPATWIQRQDGGPAYVYWPCIRNIRKLNELFDDEYSTPSEIWEKYECDILCRNIPTLASADKMIETMEMEYQQESIAIPRKNTAPASQPSVRVRQELQSNYRSDANVQSLLSCINSQLVDSDPLDIKPCPQLLDLMNEMKAMIQKNQDEIRKRLKEGFDVVEKSLIAHKMESTPMQYATESEELCVTANIPAFDRKEKFKVETICSVEELEQLEERLNDEEFLKKVCGWIDTSLGVVRESEHRMHIFLDQIMDRKLFATFSWTGAGNNKRALNVHKNILGLFEYAGTTPMQRVDCVKVEQFIRKKLHNSVTRAKAKGVRKSVPHTRKRSRRSKYVLVNAKSQKTVSGTRARGLPRQAEQCGQAEVNAADNLRNEECIVIKDDPAAYIDVMENYEDDMMEYRPL
ncbi:uncharacterized protein LOC126567624 [Anopheles maculipalpis]|uniref:uncharacterized protein LOC126567624 n=1 Tax=Anopheles maculipalpis TaxID=1496333 RepID=UPI002158FD7A|nr:uncharacterized protein LOC126567624 [Anopheles maculipalpis]